MSVAVSASSAVQRTLLSTMLGACGASFVGLVPIFLVTEKVIDRGTGVSSLLAGLVAITSDCAVFHP